MNDALTDFLVLFLNPWNGVVMLGVVMGVEVLKYTAPAFFGNGGRGNRLLRIMCVGGCVIGYQVPGPWVDPGTLVQVKVVVGGLIGGVTTIGYALVADFVKFLRRRDPSAETADRWSESAKKWVTVLGALAAAVSGFYGAWFRPETGAKKSYVVTAEAIETLSRDVEALQTALTRIDKSLSIDLAVMAQRVEDMERVMERRLSYRPARKEVVVPEPEVLMDVTTVEATADKGPRIKKNGAQIQMPAAREVF